MSNLLMLFFLSIYLCLFNIYQSTPVQYLSIPVQYLSIPVQYLSVYRYLFSISLCMFDICVSSHIYHTISSCYLVVSIYCTISACSHLSISNCSCLLSHIYHFYVYLLPEKFVLSHFDF